MAALAEIEATDNGMVVYVLDHEGRGHGLAMKLQVKASSARTNTSFSQALANLGEPTDVRSFDGAAEVLLRYGLSRVTLLTSNRDKLASIEERGVVADRRPLVAPARSRASGLEEDAKRSNPNYFDDR